MEEACDLFADDGNNIKLLQDLTKDDIVGMIFSSYEDADSFYKSYSMAKGFSVRIRQTKKHKETLDVIQRRWVCSNQGVREEKYQKNKDPKRQPQDETRCFCMATFRVKYDNESLAWKAEDFVTEHTHELGGEKFSQFYRSHRLVSACDWAQINSMRYVGIRPTHIMKYVIHQAGSSSNTPYRQRDMYNKIDRHQNSDREAGDVEKAFVYMKCKQSKDPGFTYEHTISDNDCLGSLFWCDSISKMDYACFGDVLAFDSTCGTNRYDKPFILLVGINHHYQTCIFGCALLDDQTESSFVWLLTAFVKSMGGITPSAVLTDGDKAMEKAIQRVFPNARHRLCAWHIMRRANSKVNRNGFLKDFKACMFSRTVDGFRDRWMFLVAKYNLQSSKWASMMYDTRKKWADPFFVDCFFGRQRANQRVESMNFVTKLFLNKKHNLYEFVQHFDTALHHIRDNELQAEFDTFNGDPVLQSHLKSLEKHAASTYTKATLKIFRKELRAEPEVVTVSYFMRGDTFVFSVSHFNFPTHYFGVEYNIISDEMSCSCKLFNSTGFPCRHMIHVMKTRHMSEIPTSCLLPRWTRNAKDGLDLSNQGEMSNNIVQMVRMGSLSSQCQELCNFASKSSSSFKHCRVELSRLTSRYKEASIEPTPQMPFVNDPIIGTRTVNDPSRTSKVTKKYKCTKCKQVGHNKARCTFNPDNGGTNLCI